MDSSKAIMKFIQEENTRRIAFRQRKNGLMKKVSDFHAKFPGNEACLIVYDGDDVNGEPTVWPKDRLHSILEEHDRLKGDTERFDLDEYFNNRKMMVEAEIARVRKEIAQVMYPTWDPCFNELTEDQLSFFMANVTAKIEACDEKINVLGKNKQHRSDKATATGFSTGMKKIMSQESVESSNPSQQLNIVMMDSTVQVDGPLNSTNQLGDDVNRDELVDQLAADVNWDELVDQLPDGVNWDELGNQGDDVFWDELGNQLADDVM